MYVYCLTDFFNLDLWPRHRLPNFADVRDSLEDLANAVTAWAETSSTPLTELTMRLYGGWHGRRVDEPVEIRDIIEQVVRRFPRRDRRTRLRLELADTPIWNKGIRLLRSVREVVLRGEPSVFRVPILCPHRGACTFQQLGSWWSGHCPDTNCSVKLEDTGTTKRQKMVDTLLATDALTIARDGLANLLVIASDDDDMIPVLLTVRSLDFATVRLKRDRSADSYYDELLETQGVETLVW